jgi:hypothetical protein
MSRSITDDDWRLQGQEHYLSAAKLSWRHWSETRPGWDHDHCSFCWAKFAAFEGPGILHDGYTTDDEYYWVCPTCAADFAQRFNFILIGGPAAT